MSAPRFVQGWILAKRAFGDTSLMLDVLTQDEGRLSLLAKGGRKNQWLQPFRLLWLGVAAGRNELSYLRQSEPLAAEVPLVGDALWCAFYLNELLVRLLFPGVTISATLFQHYGDTLRALSDGINLQQPLRMFEWALLEECGYAFDPTCDVHGSELLTAAIYQLTADGLAVAATDGVPGDHLLAWQRGEWRPDIARSIKQLMRSALLPHLGNKPLKTVEMFRSLKRH